MLKICSSEQQDGWTLEPWNLPPAKLKCPCSVSPPHSSGLSDGRCWQFLLLFWSYPDFTEPAEPTSLYLLQHYKVLGANKSALSAIVLWLWLGKEQWWEPGITGEQSQWPASLVRAVTELKPDVERDLSSKGHRLRHHVTQVGLSLQQAEMHGRIRLLEGHGLKKRGFLYKEGIFYLPSTHFLQRTARNRISCHSHSVLCGEILEYCKCSVCWLRRKRRNNQELHKLLLILSLRKNPLPVCCMCSQKP